MRCYSVRLTLEPDSDRWHTLQDLVFGVVFPDTGDVQVDILLLLTLGQFANRAFQRLFLLSFFARS